MNLTSNLAPKIDPKSDQNLDFYVQNIVFPSVQECMTLLHIHEIAIFNTPKIQYFGPKNPNFCPILDFLAILES